MTRTQSTLAWLVAALLATSSACTRGDAPAPAPAPTATAAANRRLVTIRTGVALDPGTGLEWTGRDHAESLPWEDADRYCRGLVVGDRRGWRLPEVDELQTIYDPRFDEPCGTRRCHVDAAIGLGGPYVWAVTTRGPGTRFYFDFGYGTRYSPTIGPELVRRTLCVRRSGD